MDLDVLFVGTAGSAPTARRGLPATLVRRGGDRLLFDCGEGTQRQLVRSIGLIELEEIFITHFHADHVLGLPGMLKTFSLRGRERPLTVYGPPGLAALFKALKPIIGKTDVRGAARSSSTPTRSSRRDGYRIAAFAVRPPRARATATRWSRTTARAASTRRAPRAGREARAGLRPAPARRDRERRCSPDQVSGEARRGRKLCSPATPRPAR